MPEVDLPQQVSTFWLAHSPDTSEIGLAVPFRDEMPALRLAVKNRWVVTRIRFKTDLMTQVLDGLVVDAEIVEDEVAS